MTLNNIIEFSSNLSLDEIKNRMEKQASWRLEYYKAEHVGKVGFYVDGKIQDIERKHGYLHGVLWGCLLRFTIEIGGPPGYFYRATIHYPEEIQNMFEAKDIRWNELTKPYDDKLRNLIVTLHGVIADID